MRSRSTISASYLAQQQELHKNPNYGVASLTYAPIVKQLLDQTEISAMPSLSALERGTTIASRNSASVGCTTELSIKSLRLQ